MVDKDKYEIILYWSEKDKLYIAEVPELPGCNTHGKSRQEALKNADDAIQLWVETAMEFGDPVPKPKGRKLMYA
jgi:predicted RNase H-like HicB family nuclease